MKSANERIKSRSQGHRRSTGRSKSIDPITSARVEYALSTLAVSGKLTGSRTERLSARVDPGLIRAARTKTGLKNNSELIIVQALRGHDITSYGDGSQTRSFCYVDDLIDGLVKLMATPNSVTGPINIGNPDEFSMLELASMIIEITGSRSRIVHRALPADDPKQRRPDISKANDLLSWSPAIPLRAGLKRTIEYFDQLLGQQDAGSVLIDGGSA